MSALEFKQLGKTGKGSSVPRVCGDPDHTAGGAARWRVSLLDYPLLEGRFKAPLVVCTPCRNRLQKTWDEALGVEEVNDGGWCWHQRSPLSGRLMDNTIISSMSRGPR